MWRVDRKEKRTSVGLVCNISGKFCTQIKAGKLIDSKYICGIKQGLTKC